MFYIKTEVGNSVTITAEINDDNVFTLCPECGEEHRADLQDAVIDGQLDLYGTAIYCAECSAKLKKMRASDKEYDGAVDLSQWVPDDKRDKLMAVSVLWADYRSLANAFGEDHAAALEARDLLERVMEGPLSGYRGEIQDRVLTVWESFDRSVEDVAEGDEELIAFYRRVLGLREEN